MSVIEFIILSIALSLETLIVMHGCAMKTPVKLTMGLLGALCISVENALMLLLGLFVGNLLRFTPDDIVNSTARDLFVDTDNLVYLGLMILVAIRLLFRSSEKRRGVQPYDISRFGTLMLLGIAVGINTMMVGLALGFRMPLADNLWQASIPLVVIMTLFALLGVMLGRSQKPIRSRRYTLFAVLFLLAFALKGAFWS